MKTFLGIIPTMAAACGRPASEGDATTDRLAAAGLRAGGAGAGNLRAGDTVE
jgi:hypothetical protein